MEILYEYRETTKRKGDPLLRTGDMDGRGKFNFRSLYGYPSETSEFIRKNGNTRNLKGKPVFSDVLLIDVDNEVFVDEVRQMLIYGNIAFTEYSTGNRGRHFHVNIEPMQGEHVIYSQVQWLKGMDLWDKIDTSVYREGGQFRCIGAIHQKTKKIKTSCGGTCGSAIKIPKVVPPPVVQTNYEIGEGTEEDQQTFLMNLLIRRGEGQRHMHIFILWRSGLKAGYDPEIVKDAIRVWNRAQDIPHEEEVLESKLRSMK